MELTVEIWKNCKTNPQVKYQITQEIIISCLPYEFRAFADSGKATVLIFENDICVSNYIIDDSFKNSLLTQIIDKVAKDVDFMIVGAVYYKYSGLLEIKMTDGSNTKILLYRAHNYEKILYSLP